MIVSIFKNVKAIEFERKQLAWEDLVQQLLNPAVYESKLNCPLLKLSEFGNIKTEKGSFRHNNNVLGVYGIEADYDAGIISFDEAVFLLKQTNIECIIYTTPSNTDVSPRWRVLAPFSEVKTPDQRTEFMARLNGAMGGIFSTESFTLSQIYYFGKISDKEYKVKHLKGYCIDTINGLVEKYPEKTYKFVEEIGEVREYTPTQNEEICYKRVEQIVLTAKPGERHFARLKAGKLAGGFIAGGLIKEDEILKRLKVASDKIDDKHKTPRTEWITILDGIKYGKEEPINKIESVLNINTEEIFKHKNLPSSSLKNGYTLLFPNEQINYFKNCVYISDINKILTPGGYLLDKQRFDVMYGGFSFVMNNENQGTPEKSAWNAFTQSQAVSHTKVNTSCFRPELEPSEIINKGGQLAVNTYYPFETDLKDGDVEPFLIHINKLFKNERDIDIILSYMAAMVQYAGIKFQWCPIIQGTEGNGKSLLGSVIEFALGEKYTHKPDATDLNNKFNGWLANKLFIAIEEIKITEHKTEILESLKPMITNERMGMQKKGEDQYTGDNRANFLMFTNYKDAVPITVDKRRYAPFFTSQQSLKDIERDGMDGDYFPNLYKWLKNGGYACVNYFLRNYKIKDELNPATTLTRAPQTSSIKEAIKSSMTAVEQDIYEAIESEMTGFRGGYINSVSLKILLNKYKLSTHRLSEIVKNMGYILHPNLQDGRLNQKLYTEEGYKKVKIYIKDGHIILNETRPNLIQKAYIDAQKEETSQNEQKFIESIF